ncbi:MAG: hypothetical protein IJG87_06555 [Ruminococcus sp.]|nr:hypothetical protein [Ruminococcus sp.]
MSVYIKGMEMPTERESYTITVKYNGLVFDTETGMQVAEAYELPPHGRLIDADALLERFEKEEKAADEHGRDFSFSFKSGGENCTEWWPVQQMLMDAPTIIPAEDSKLSATIKCGGAVTCAVAHSEEVYNKYVDTAGNLRWTGTHSGKHIVKAEEGE